MRGMEYLVRFAQVHETFHVPELEALAELANIELAIMHYHHSTPFCIIRLEDEAAARLLMSRAILCQAIYELWGQAEDYPSLHEILKTNAAVELSQYTNASFRFDVDCYQGSHTAVAQLELIESFRHLPLRGPVKMKHPDISMCIFEEYEKIDATTPRRVYLGRLICAGVRHLVDVYSLKKRRYISRTSMEAELSLVTANLMLAAPGKIVYDPFVGTGSFSVACACFGAMAMGSDIDGRSMRGTNRERNLYANFVQYGTTANFLDSFVSDLTHTPLRDGQFFDGIVCDPPYGIREGPKVLGDRHKDNTEVVFIDGIAAHLREGYIPPKRPYGFDDMMADVLDFAFAKLVIDGRLAIWMPTANDEDIELAIPMHPGLRLVSVCVQHFNKWARRLLVYRRLPNGEVPPSYIPEVRLHARGGTAGDLNPFRKKYFAGFKGEQLPNDREI